MEALGINAGNLFVNIICFIIAFLIIVKLIYKPMQKMMDARKEVIENGLKDAKAAAESREQAEKEYQEKIEAAKQESANILKESSDQVAKMKSDYRSQVDDEALKELKDSREYLQKERELMLTNLRGQIIDLSMSGARKIIGEDLKMDEDRQREILKTLFTGIKDGTIPGIDHFPNELKSVDITTAIPLTADERQLMLKHIEPKLAPAVSPKFAVDPKILGGIIIHSGDYLVDASVLGAAQELKEALHK